MSVSPDSARPQRVRRRVGSRRRSDRGAVIVEMAIIVPFLISVVCGVVDFGFAFHDWNAVRQGARDAMRVVVADITPPAPQGGWSCPITGSGSGVPGLVCYTKAQVGLNANNTRVKVYFATPFTAGNAVKVCVQYTVSSKTGFYGAILNDKVLNSTVESLIERTDPSLTPVAETAITSWPASCSTL